MYTFLFVLWIWSHEVRLSENILIYFCASYRAHTGEFEEFLNRSENRLSINLKYYLSSIVTYSLIMVQEVYRTSIQTLY
jgi:hypothetical protein